VSGGVRELAGREPARLATIPEAHRDVLLPLRPPEKGD
jgi:hypothetical protein